MVILKVFRVMLHSESDSGSISHVRFTMVESKSDDDAFLDPPVTVNPLQPARTACSP